MASLMIDSGSLTGKRRDIVRDVLVLGRDTGCDVVFADDTVSRKHARIVRGADGYYLEDLQSRNGTFVNGRRINTPTRLRDGDSLQLYDVGVTFSDGFVPPPARPQSAGSGVWLAPTSGSGVWLVQEDPAGSQSALRMSATVAEVDATLGAGTWVNEQADERLQAVLDVSRHLRSWVDLPELYQRILDCLQRIFPQLELACVLRLETDGGPLAIEVFRTSGGLGPLTAGPIMESIVRQAFADGKALLSVDASADPLPDASGQIHTVEHRCVMCAPLLDSLRTPLGALYLETAKVPQPFTAADLDVLACVALLTSQAVEQGTLHNARYRAAVNLSTDAIITFDSEGRIESFNPAATDLFGYDTADMRGAFLRDLTPDLAPLVTPCDEEQSASVLWTFRRSTESIGRRADGSTFPVRLSVGELKLGGRRLFTASIHDITEHKRIEHSLQRSNEELERAVEQRSSYIVLHQDVATIANEAESELWAFQAALDRIRETTAWAVGHVWVRSDDDAAIYVDAGIWSTAAEGEFEALEAATRLLHVRADADRSAGGRVIASRRACRAVGPAAVAHDPRAEILQALDLQNVLAFPVFVGDDVAAVMEFFAPTHDEPEDGLLTVMAHVGMQLGRVMERRRLQIELVDAVWDQQRVFGQELHDTIGQELAGSLMVARSLARKLTERGVTEVETSRELAEMLQHAKLGVRRLAKGLLPVEVDADGLKAALEELAETTAERCQIAVDVWCDERLKLTDNKVATHLFRIAQEAVTNAVRHAEAQHLALRFARNADGDIELSVSDDGNGMPTEERRPGRGVGLQIMKYRAQAIYAEFEIQPGAGGGTVVACRLQRSNQHVSNSGRRAVHRAHRG